MAVLIVLLVWFIGAVISARIYYQRRCGVRPSSGAPGIANAVIPSMAWPFMWFVEGWREPAPCRHPAHAKNHAARRPALAVPQTAAARSGPTGLSHADAEPGPESDGFSEGDRVKLAKPFWGKPGPDNPTLLKDWAGPSSGDVPTYPAGSEGTIFYPDDASPELIRDMKADGKYLVAMDDGQQLYAGGPFPGVEGTALERIPGHYQVGHQKGKVYIRPKFHLHDRVELTETFTSQGKTYEAGWEGRIGSLTMIISECWETGEYPVRLDPDPFGAVWDEITVSAEALKLVPEGRDG